MVRTVPAGTAGIHRCTGGEPSAEHSRMVRFILKDAGHYRRPPLRWVLQPDLRVTLSAASAPARLRPTPPSALVAWYASFATVTNSTWKRTALPVWPLG
ncbi:hypothetical protein P3T39_000977 [Kitasatospora sp. GP82]|nr:hypothetical protein [Kitasatospora sp. GP82]